MHLEKIMKLHLLGIMKKMCQIQNSLRKKQMMKTMSKEQNLILIQEKKYCVLFWGV